MLRCSAPRLPLQYMVKNIQFIVFFIQHWFKVSFPMMEEEQENSIFPFCKICSQYKNWKKPQYLLDLR